VLLRMATVLMSAWTVVLPLHTRGSVDANAGVVQQSQGLATMAAATRNKDATFTSTEIARGTQIITRKRQLSDFHAFFKSGQR